MIRRICNVKQISGQNYIDPIIIEMTHTILLVWANWPMPIFSRETPDLLSMTSLLGIHVEMNLISYA